MCRKRMCSPNLKAAGSRPNRVQLIEAQAGDMLYSSTSLSRVPWVIRNAAVQNWALIALAASSQRVLEVMQSLSRRQAFLPQPDAGSLFTLKPARPAWEPGATLSQLVELAGHV